METLLYNGVASAAPAAPGAGAYAEDCPLRLGLCPLQPALGGWKHPEPQLASGASQQREEDTVNTCRWLLFVHFVTRNSPLWHLPGEGSVVPGAGLPGQGAAELGEPLLPIPLPLRLPQGLSPCPLSRPCSPFPGCWPLGACHRGMALALPAWQHLVFTCC